MPCSRSIVPLPSPGIGRNLAPIGVGSAGFLRGRALHQSAGRSPWNCVSSAIADAWLSASVQRPRRLQPRLRRSGAAVRSITSMLRKKSAVSYDGNDRPSPLLSSSKMPRPKPSNQSPARLKCGPYYSLDKSLRYYSQAAAAYGITSIQIWNDPVTKDVAAETRLGRGGGGSRGKPTRPDERA